MSFWIVNCCDSDGSESRLSRPGLIQAFRRRARWPGQRYPAAPRIVGEKSSTKSRRRPVRGEHEPSCSSMLIRSIGITFLAGAIAPCTRNHQPATGGSGIHTQAGSIARTNRITVATGCQHDLRHNTLHAGRPELQRRDTDPSA